MSTSGTASTLSNAPAQITTTFQLTPSVAKFINEVLYSALSINAQQLNALFTKLEDLKVKDPETYNKYVDAFNAARPRVNGKQYAILHDMALLLHEQVKVREALDAVGMTSPLYPLIPSLDSGISTGTGQWYYTILEKLIDNNLRAANIDLFVGSNDDLKPAYVHASDNTSIILSKVKDDATRDEVYTVKSILQGIDNAIAPPPVVASPVDVEQVVAQSALRQHMDMRDNGEDNIFSYEQGIPVASARYMSPVAPRYAAALQYR